MTSPSRPGRPSAGSASRARHAQAAAPAPVPAPAPASSPWKGELFKNLLTTGLSIFSACVVYMLTQRIDEQLKVQDEQIKMLTLHETTSKDLDAVVDSLMHKTAQADKASGDGKQEEPEVDDTKDRLTALRIAMYGKGAIEPLVELVITHGPYNVEAPRDGLRLLAISNKSDVCSEIATFLAAPTLLEVAGPDRVLVLNRLKEEIKCG